MSANPVARPLSTRRSFLAAGTAVAAIGAPAIATAGPDPVFALIEAERVAFERWGDAIDAVAVADEAFTATGLNRAARVQTGTLTTIVDKNGDTLPESEWTETPIYAHSREEIRRAYTTVPEPVDVRVGTDRRVRVETVNTGALEAALAAFDADRMAIKNCPERVASCRAEDLCAWHQDEAEAALQAVCQATPTTAAGILAMIDLFDAREAECLSAPHDAMLSGIFAAVRSLVTREASEQHKALALFASPQETA